MKILLLLSMFIPLCFIIFGQDSMEIKHNLRPGSLDIDDKELLKSIELDENVDRKFQTITDLLDSDSTAWKIKICLLGEYLKEENTYNLIFSDWLLQNIDLKISLEPIRLDMILYTRLYPVLNFIVTLKDPHFVTPEDVFLSDLLKICKLLEQPYERVFLTTLLYEYFIINKFDFNKMALMLDDLCTTDNVQEMKRICSKP